MLIRLCLAKPVDFMHDFQLPPCAQYRGGDDAMSCCLPPPDRLAMRAGPGSALRPGQSECCMPVDGEQPQICPVKLEPHAGSPYQLLNKVKGSWTVGDRQTDGQTAGRMDGQARGGSGAASRHCGFSP